MVNDAFAALYFDANMIGLIFLRPRNAQNGNRAGQSNKPAQTSAPTQLPEQPPPVSVLVFIT